LIFLFNNKLILIAILIVIALVIPRSMPILRLIFIVIVNAILLRLLAVDMFLLSLNLIINSLLLYIN